MTVSIKAKSAQKSTISGTCNSITIANFVCFTMFLSPHAVNCGRFCFWCHQSAVLFVYEISPELLNGFAPNSHGRHLVPHSDEFEGQGHQGQKTAFFGPFEVK